MAHPSPPPPSSRGGGVRTMFGPGFNFISPDINNKNKIKISTVAAAFLEDE